MIVDTTATGHLLVRSLERYVSLPDEDKTLLVAINYELRHVSAGTDLVLEGAPPNGAFVIVKGFACRYQLLACGKRHITAYLLPGDFCDLDVLFLQSMDHSIGTLSTCTVAQLAPTMVEHLLRRPALARALRLATLAETANLRDWLVNVGARRATVRAAHLFCGLHARMQAVGLAENDRFDFPLKQDQMADTIGLSTVHTNRSLQELRSAKLIELRRSHLTILDVSRLRTFAQYQPNYLQRVNASQANG